MGRLRTSESLGHVITRDETGLREKYFKVNGEIEQKMGRPRFGWLEDEENDLRELKVSR